MCKKKLEQILLDLRIIRSEVVTTIIESSFNYLGGTQFIEFIWTFVVNSLSKITPDFNLVSSRIEIRNCVCDDFITNFWNTIIRDQAKILVQTRVVQVGCEHHVSE